MVYGNTQQCTLPYIVDENKIYDEKLCFVYHLFLIIQSVLFLFIFFDFSTMHKRG